MAITIKYPKGYIETEAEKAAKQTPVAPVSVTEVPVTKLPTELPTKQKTIELNKELVNG